MSLCVGSSVRLLNSFSHFKIVSQHLNLICYLTSRLWVAHKVCNGNQALQTWTV